MNGRVTRTAFLLLIFSVMTSIGNFLCMQYGQHQVRSPAYKVHIVNVQNLIFTICKCTKSMPSFSIREGICGHLLRCSDSSSVYPLMTFSVHCPAIKPRFALIRRTMQEEFVKRSSFYEFFVYELYEFMHNIRYNMYIVEYVTNIIIVYFIELA